MHLEGFEQQRLETILPENGWGIYIHVPFCIRRCKYCAFVSSVPRPVPHEIYTKAVIQEYYLRRKCRDDRRLLTLYFGGGTPSTLPDASLERIVSVITREEGMPSEITLEVNPEHVTPERANHWKSIGFTRISMGIQSFDDNMLKFLGRKHDGNQARKAVEILSAAGFDEICIDLIYGGSYDDNWTRDHALRRWQDDLRIARSLLVSHVSCYELTLEPHTPLWTLEKRGHCVTCEEDVIVEMMEMIPDMLGCYRYEISNYSRDGYFSGHNLSCWSGLPYLGLGPGAHSLILSGGTIQRHANVGEFGVWSSPFMESDPRLPEPLLSETLSAHTHLSERFMCAARTCLWWNPRAISAQLNESLDPYMSGIQEAVDSGLLERREDGCLRTTSSGILLNNVLDELICDF